MLIDLHHKRDIQPQNVLFLSSKFELVFLGAEGQEEKRPVLYNLLFKKMNSNFASLSMS